jgi:hypothetical protein
MPTSNACRPRWAAELTTAGVVRDHGDARMPRRSRSAPALAPARKNPAEKVTKVRPIVDMLMP